MVKGLRVKAIPKYCLRDLATAKFWYKDDKGGMREVVVASAYFPYESNLCPTAEAIELIKLFEDKGWDLFLGCDANVHNLAWGSSDTNNREEKLLQFLYNTNLDFLNRGCKPTFQNCNREEVIDITLASRNMGNAITGWRVSDEVSMSDHNHIVFEIKGRSTESRLYRNLGKTDWAIYVEELGAKLKSFPGRYSNQMELDHCSEVLKNNIVSAFENNCRLRTPAVMQCKIDP